MAVYLERVSAKPSSGRAIYRKSGVYMLPARCDPGSRVQAPQGFEVTRNLDLSTRQSTRTSWRNMRLKARASARNANPINDGLVRISSFPASLHGHHDARGGGLAGNHKNVRPTCPPEGL